MGTKLPIKIPARGDIPKIKEWLTRAGSPKGAQAQPDVAPFVLLLWHFTLHLLHAAHRDAILEGGHAGTWMPRGIRPSLRRAKRTRAGAGFGRDRSMGDHSLNLAGASGSRPRVPF